MAAGNAGIGDRDLQGFKHFRSLRKLLFRLHEVGTKRDAAGNRQLHMDQYCVLVRLWLFNPAIRTLRGLQRVTEFDKVRKRLGVNRTSLGSRSESVRIFDPTAFATIAAELSLHLPAARCLCGTSVQRQGAGRGCPCPESRRRWPAEAWMPQRRHLRANAAQDGRSERPATGHGQPRPSQDVASTSGNPRAERDCHGGLCPRTASGPTTGRHGELASPPPAVLQLKLVR